MFGEVGSDDRVFLLPRADRKLCEAKTSQLYTQLGSILVRTLCT